MIEIINAKYEEGFKVFLQFNNGKSGEVDFNEVVNSDPVFARLKDPSIFQNFKIKYETLSWNDDIDIAPEYLYFLAFKNENSLQTQFRNWGYIK